MQSSIFSTLRTNRFTKTFVDSSASDSFKAVRTQGTYLTVININFENSIKYLLLNLAVVCGQGFPAGHFYRNDGYHSQDQVRVKHHALHFQAFESKHRHCTTIIITVISLGVLSLKMFLIAVLLSLSSSGEGVWLTILLRDYWRG